MHKIRTHHNHPQGRIFSWMVLILGTGIGLILPILPNFVKSIVKTDFGVSLFFAAMALITILAALSSTVIFKRVERAKITKYSFAICGAISLFLIFVTTLTELSIAQSISVWFNLFLLMTLALFVRDFSKSTDLGKEEGLFYLFQNIGYFIGPILGGFLSVYFGYEFVFILAAIVMFSGLFYFYKQHTIEQHPAIVNLPKTTASGLIKNIREYFSSKERTKAYAITFIVMGWVGFKRLYIPLYVFMTGYVESMSGLILALGILPLMFFEVAVGKYADKKGIKIPISLGFLIMGLILFVVFLSPFPLLNFALLILVNLGLALIEPLQEYFLFKNLPKEKEDELYGIYMTADPVSYFVVPAIGALILLVLPFKFLFLSFGALTLLASFLAWTMLKDQ